MTTPATTHRPTATSGHWLILLASAVLEAVWASALGASQGLTLLAPSVLFGLALLASMVGLAVAVRRIPLGTAYAVWVGIGAALTVGWAMATGAETASPAKVIFLVAIVAAVIGLKLAGHREDPSPSA